VKNIKTEDTEKSETHLTHN